MNRTLISILAGLGGMFGWGTSDFLANVSSEKVGHSKTFLWSQVAGLTLIGLVVLFTMPSFAISPFFLMLAVACGAAYASGYLLFYKGFEIGNVSVVSAVINLQVLFVMAISFFVRGQTLTLIQIPAMILLLVGILLVSVNFNELRKGSITLLAGVKETLASAVIFGALYWPLNEFVVEQNNWLAITFLTKLIAIALVFLLFILKKEVVTLSQPSRKIVLLITGIGLLEALGVLSANFGQSYGDGIIVAPVSSALTVVTVTLAMIFLKEKITKIQALGIGLAVMGIILTAF